MSTLMLNAQVNQIFTSTPGQLSSQIASFLMQNNSLTIASITKITINGTMDERDLLALNQYTISTNGDVFKNIASIDLSTVTINAYDIYPANQFNSFYNNTLTSIILPSSITSIGKMALQSSVNLTRISIPSSVTFIDQNAFSYSKKVTSISIP
jgi:hypothetical protein